MTKITRFRVFCPAHPELPGATWTGSEIDTPEERQQFLLSFSHRASTFLRLCNDGDLITIEKTEQNIGHSWLSDMPLEVAKKTVEDFIASERDI